MKNKKVSGLRGQAAMEYLMTYGWAILVIVVVLALLLFYLPQFLRAPESCIFAQPGFSCSQQRPTIYVPSDSDQVHMTIRVFNGQGKTVNVHNMLCTTAPTGDVDTGDAEPIVDDLATEENEEHIPSAGGRTYDAECKDERGDPLMLSAGSEDFRGNFIIWYNYQDDVRQDIPRQATAVVSGPVLKG